MSLRPENLPRDPDVLIGMVIERDVEIERLKTALKTLNSLIHGPRSERASVVLEGQTILDLGDLETDVTLVAANDDASTLATAPGVKPRKKARRNIGFLPKHLPRVEEVIEPESTDCPCCAGKLHRIGEETGEALDGVPAALPRLLLSHNPDTAEMSAARTRQYRVDLMLCGHTHGGQVRIPGLGTPVIPSNFGQKYAHGLVRGPGFRVFISSGLGTTGMPIRFRQPPEIALRTLVPDVC